MKTSFTLSLVASAMACSSAPDAYDQTGLYSREAAEVARFRSGVQTSEEPESIAAEGALPDFSDLKNRAAERYGEAATLEGLVPVPTEALRALAADDAALERRLREGPLETDELLQLVWLRDPTLEARRSALEAELQGYDQVRLLEDVIDRFRAFVHTSQARIGVSTRADGVRSQVELAPYPSIEALRGEMVESSVEQRWHELRAAAVRGMASALEEVAHLTWIETDHEIAAEHLVLLEAQEPVTRTRVASGSSPQSDLLTLQAELERLKSRLGELEAARGARAAELAGWIDRDAQPAPSATATALEQVLVQAEGQAALRAGQPELAAARTALTRSVAALRLAEIMALGPTDLGLSRFDRGLTGKPGVTPDASFGPREALLRSMRERSEQLEHERRAVLRRCLADQESARRAREAADLRLRVHREELTPRAWAAYEAIAVAWSNGQASFLELIDAADRLHIVQLGYAQAERDARLADVAQLIATGRR